MAIERATDDNRVTGGNDSVSRRTLLAGVGAAGVFSFAGCLGGGGDGTPTTTKDYTVEGRTCDGVVPSLETAKSGEYKPLSRPLFTYPSVASLEKPQVAEFARFFVEKSADESLIADRVGYVPKTEEEMQAEMDALDETIAEAGGPAPGDAGELSGEISIAGSSTVFPVAEALAEEFQKQHPDVSISLQSTGSGGGFSNFFCKGQTDFNNASRPIESEETQICADNGVEYHEINVATDALTVVVNNDNRWAQCLTVDELRQIWADGGANTWSDVHEEWPDEKIERFGAAETSGTFDYFNEAIIGEENTHTSDYQPTENDNTIVNGVKGSKFAIGYFGFAYYTRNPDQSTAVAIDATGSD